LGQTTKRLKSLGSWIDQSWRDFSEFIRYPGMLFKYVWGLKFMAVVSKVRFHLFIIEYLSRILVHCMHSRYKTGIVFNITWSWSTVMKLPSLATKDERSLIKTLPIRVRIFNVCQEHLTGFNLISQSRSTSSKLIGWANWNHQMSSQTLNFVGLKKHWTLSWE
jgi:hypothetical protein